MNEIPLAGLFWLAGALAPLLFLQRWLHHYLQGFFLLLTRRPDLSIALYSLLFFPGVLLHETSHYLAARLLGVRTGRFSVIPRPLPDGRLQLGYVETVAADPLREALIGAAPLLTGGLVVAFIGVNRLGLLVYYERLRQLGVDMLLPGLAELVRQPDFWLWFYLLFTVSSTMLPSASDRRAWLPLALVGGLLLGLSLLAGAGDWLLANLAAPFNRLLLSAATVFFISDFAHLVFLPPVYLAYRLLSGLTGLEVRNG